MAENDEDRNPEDLSEDASPYRLEDFRRKGQVSQSKELVALFVAVASGMVLFSFAPMLAETLSKFMHETLELDLVVKPGANMQEVAGNKLIQMLKVMGAANRNMVHLTPLDGRQDFHRPC